MKVLNKTTALIKCDQSYGCNATIPFYTDYITDCVEETRPYDENAAKPTVFTNLYYKYSDGNPENKYIFDSKTQDSNIVVQVVWTVVKFGNGSSTSTVCTISPTFSNRSESSYTGTLSKTIIPDSIPPIKSTNQMKSLNDTRISSSVYTVGLLGVSLNRFINPSNLNGILRS